MLTLAAAPSDPNDGRHDCGQIGARQVGTQRFARRNRHIQALASEKCLRSRAGIDSSLGEFPSIG
jgi:hypothetical protein